MSVKRFFRAICFVVAIVVCYLAIAFISKRLVLFYYEQHDKNIDWFAEYQNIPIKDKYKVVIINSSTGPCGDISLGKRVVEAAKNLGWEAIEIEDVNQEINKVKEFNPDFLFTNLYDMQLGLTAKLADYKIYGLLSNPINVYFYNRVYALMPQFRKNGYHNIQYLDGLIVSAPQISLFKKYMENHGQKFYGFVDYPSMKYTDFVEVSPQELVYSGSNWDRKRGGKKFIKIYKLLAEKTNTVFYGPEEAWKDIVGKAYKGFIEGSNATNDMLRKHGISLSIHGDTHIRNKVPSGRIFEAAASGAVAISDKHPFVIENFGYNVFYVDTEKSAEDVVSQIGKHLAWIKENPERVKEMQRNAYDVFVKKYTLESLLIKLAHMHEKVLLDSK